MKYFGNEHDFTNSSNKTGVLLINLGTPDRPVCPGLRDYLSEFLMDPRVIELPKLLRWILVRGIIVNTRSHKSAAAYREVWTEQGSPLLLNTEKLTHKTASLLSSDDFVVDYAMRYGNPSIESKVQAMHEKGIRNLVVIPLYPQYSGSTNGSTFDGLSNAFKKQRWIPNLNFISDYYQNPLYINAISDSIRQHWQNNGKAQKLLMSFHGIPKKYSTRGDPYEQQCEWTAHAIAKNLGINQDEWMLVFQSRLGAEQWLQPYCDQTLKTLPSQGIKSIDILCPGFSADCLETLEEIEQENREYFIEAGGENYHYIPCLNDEDNHAALMADLVKNN